MALHSINEAITANGPMNLLDGIWAWLENIVARVESCTYVQAVALRGLGTRYRYRYRYRYRDSALVVGA